MATKTATVGSAAPSRSRKAGSPRAKTAGTASKKTVSAPKSAAATLTKHAQPATLRPTETRRKAAELKRQNSGRLRGNVKLDPLLLQPAKPADALRLAAKPKRAAEKPRTRPTGAVPAAGKVGAKKDAGQLAATDLSRAKLVGKFPNLAHQPAPDAKLKLAADLRRALLRRMILR